MKGIPFILALVFLLTPLSSSAQTTKERKTTTTTTTTTTVIKKPAIVGQDSMSKKNAERKEYQNRKRRHTKNIYEDKEKK